MLGRYSVMYFVFLVLVVGSLFYIAFLFFHFGQKAIYVVLANLILLVMVIIFIEILAQVYFYLNPAYDVLFLQPDKAVGWKQVPHLNWTWTGHFWYAREFSVSIETNSQGFRDIEREYNKPPGVVRVAILGDSMVEAVQVSFDKTSGHLLEQKLNNKLVSPASLGSDRYEVLNFGISNYSVGQYLLAWETYAAKFNPDYVFVFITKRQLDRISNRYVQGGFVGTQQQKIWIRPTFRLKNGMLVREPARDLDQFVEFQNQVIDTELNGQRMRIRKPGWFIPYSLDLIENSLLAIYHWLVRAPKPANASVPITPITLTANNDLTNMLQLNEKVIEELGQKISASGGTLIIVDATSYYDPDWTIIQQKIEQFSAKKNFGYVPLYKYLHNAQQNQIQTRWNYDSHFNEAGNQIFAEAMYQWVIENGSK